MSLEIRVCQSCGKEFKAKNSPSRIGRGKFCSKECKDVIQKPTLFKCEFCKKEFHIRPSKVSKRRFCSQNCRKGFETVKQNQTTIKNCVYCKKEMVLTHSKRNKRFCSNSCIRKALKPPTFEIRQCKYCSIQFQVSPPSVKNIYCSRRCGNHATALKKIKSKEPIIKNCLYCNKEFSVRYWKATVKFCSKGCQHDFGRSEKICPVCEKTFIRQKSDPRTHCSKECFYETFFPNGQGTCLDCGETFPLEMLSKGYKKGSGKKLTCKPCRSVRWHNMRAKRRKAVGVYTGQQWRDKLKFFNNCCYLCGDSLKNKTVHAEHRKPISRGGSNWIANIAPACPKCNWSKKSLTEKEFREWRQSQEVRL